MTNDKAIKWLKVEASCIEEDVGHGKEILEAYDMAIEALERDNSVLERVKMRESCGDCISRQAVLEVLETEWNMYSNADDAMQESIDDIKALPPVTPQPKVGEWLEKEVHSDKVIEEWQSARCSVCDKYHTTPYMYYFSNYKFCPNCGARMEVET